MFLNFGHFSASRLYKKGSYKKELWRKGSTKITSHLYEHSSEEMIRILDHE